MLPDSRHAFGQAAFSIVEDDDPRGVFAKVWELSAVDDRQTNSAVSIARETLKFDESAHVWSTDHTNFQFRIPPSAQDFMGNDRLQRTLAAAIRSSGRTSAAAPRCTASLGIP
jgi:hypothetical protein